MRVINARNVHHALPEALYQLAHAGVQRPSRNGPVLKFPTPVTTVYERPLERVLFWAQRDANPFFHFFESIWMLAGRNDVAFPASFAKQISAYSDDGETLHGAYGHRWRDHFQNKWGEMVARPFDQLDSIVKSLKANPDDRRQVLTMWDPAADLGGQGKDLPCNVCAVFQVNDEGHLNMTVFNRSNDIIWGAYGANAVHFSYLLEYVACRVGLNPGQYYQVSTNFHAYKNEVYEKVSPLADLARDPLSGCGPECPYSLGQVEPYPLMSTPPGEWEDDLRNFMVSTTGTSGAPWSDPFFRHVAYPLLLAHRAYKSAQPQRFNVAHSYVASCHATDWRLACHQWLDRREAAVVCAEGGNQHAN